MTEPKRLSSPWLAVGELLMILPAALFVASAAGRTMLGHGLPAAVVLSGSAAIARTWKNDVELGQDMKGATAAIWKHRSIVLISVSTIAAAAILTLVVGHIITD